MLFVLNNEICCLSGSLFVIIGDMMMDFQGMNAEKYEELINSFEITLVYIMVNIVHFGGGH